MICCIHQIIKHIDMIPISDPGQKHEVGFDQYLKVERLWTRINTLERGCMAIAVPLVCQEYMLKNGDCLCFWPLLLANYHWNIALLDAIYH